jgi:hypothetical protein
MGQVAAGCPFHVRAAGNISPPLCQKIPIAWRNVFWIWCPSCQARGPTRFSEAEAINEWNALVPPENLNEKLETFRITNDPERN